MEKKLFTKKIYTVIIKITFKEVPCEKENSFNKTSSVL